MPNSQKPAGKCPVCGVSQAKYGYKDNRFPLKNMVSHIKAFAKSELFERELLNPKAKTPHLTYIKKNMIVVGFPQIVLRSK